MKYKFALYALLFIACTNTFAQVGEIRTDSIWVFEELFNDDKNENNWILVQNEADLKSYIVPGEGLRMRTSLDEGFTQTISIPVDLSKSFTVETTVRFQNGDRNSYFGIVYNGSDAYNYSCFLINAAGSFSIGGKKNGLVYNNVDEKKTEDAYPGYKDNNLKIVIDKNMVQYLINNAVVFQEIQPAFTGTRFGFISSSGKKEVLFYELIITQDLAIKKIKETSNIEDQKIEQDKTQEQISSKTKDIIIRIDGSEINVQVIEVGTETITYKKIENPSGPIYTIPKREVFIIRYGNGNVDKYPENLK